MADGTLQARAIRMLHAGDPAKLVAQTTGLALTDVQQLQRDTPGLTRSSQAPLPSHVDRSHMPGYGDVIVWQLTGRVAVSAAVTYLEGGTLPSKKRAELALLREALLLVPRPGQHIDDAAVVRQHEIREELKTVRRFERSA